MSGVESPMDTRYSIRYASKNLTTYCSLGEWNGRSVLVVEPLWDEDGPCPGHDLGPMTYFGEDTGSLYCWRCCGSVSQAERKRAERE